MKETVNASVGSIAFVLDKDAYQVLENYFHSIQSRLPKDDFDTVKDVEFRVAELLQQKTKSPFRVVTIQMVRDAIDTIGAPDCFGEGRPEEEKEKSPHETCSQSKKISRSTEDCVIAGVCGGVAEFFGLDSSLIRLITLILILFGGLSIWVYVILWIVLPKTNTRYGN